MPLQREIGALFLVRKREGRMLLLCMLFLSCLQLKVICQRGLFGVAHLIPLMAWSILSSSLPPHVLAAHICPYTSHDDSLLYLGDLFPSLPLLGQACTFHLHTPVASTGWIHRRPHKLHDGINDC